MKTPRLIAKAFFLVASLAAFGGCYATVSGGDTPSTECRTVTVRKKSDVEVCHKHCNDNGCHEHCEEQAKYARERHCWTE